MREQKEVRTLKIITVGMIPRNMLWWEELNRFDSDRRGSGRRAQAHQSSLNTRLTDLPAGRPTFGRGRQRGYCFGDKRVPPSEPATGARQTNQQRQHQVVALLQTNQR